MKYQAPCTEEEFNVVIKMALDADSQEWTRVLADLDFGACQLKQPVSGNLQTVFDNAVAMGLMTKREFKNLSPVYQVATQTQQLRA